MGVQSEASKYLERAVRLLHIVRPEKAAKTRIQTHEVRWKVRH